jgi:hypothetical protein
MQGRDRGPLPTIVVLASASTNVAPVFAPLYSPPPSGVLGRGRAWQFDLDQNRVGSRTASQAGVAATHSASRPLLSGRIRFGSPWLWGAHTLLCPAPLDSGLFQALERTPSERRAMERYGSARTTAGILLLLNPDEEHSAALDYRVWLLRYLTYLLDFSGVPPPRKLLLPFAVVGIPPRRGWIDPRALLKGSIRDLAVLIERRIEPAVLRYYWMTSQAELRATGARGDGRASTSFPMLLRWLTRAAQYNRGIGREPSAWH